MLFSTSTSTSLFFSVLLASTSTTLAAPTRTHCRCAIVYINPSPATESLSLAHWMPSDLTPSSTVTDICSSLGPELENFRHTEPALYDAYVGQSSNKDDEEPKRPIPTRILMAIAGRKSAAVGNDQGEPRPTARPQQRIVCRSEPESFETYQGSFVNLWALQLIIGLAVFACVAEGIHLSMRWMNQRQQTPITPANPISEKSRLRLPGGERRLLAIPPLAASAGSVYSPGAEKKLRAYESTRYFVTQTPSGRKEFIAYDDEDDDEANRPVM